MVLFVIVKEVPGWPRHRDNREFGSYFFQTGKNTGNFAVNTGKKLETQGKYFDSDY